MGQATRLTKYDKFWRGLEPSLKGYSAAIDKLLRYLSDDDLDQVLADMDEAEAECQRCGSLLNEQGHCQDETCPFSDTDQDDERGWAGHPDH